MSLKIKAGTRLRSAACTTELVVVRAAEAEVDLRCGGAPMDPLGAQPASVATPSTPFDQGTQLGKRYASADGDVELLCTKAGAGSLSIGETPLELKAAKPLPASD